MLAGQANMSKSSMHLAYDVCRAEARHIHKVHHEFKAGRVAGPMCWWHHAHSSAESIESCFCGEDGEADEYLSGKDWATEASQAPMGLAAIYCHPLEFFLSDLMYFPQTITVPSTTATNPFSKETLWNCEGPRTAELAECLLKLLSARDHTIWYNLWGRLRWHMLVRFFQFLRPLGAGLVAVRTNGFTGVGLSVRQKEESHPFNRWALWHL